MPGILASSLILKLIKAVTGRDPSEVLGALTREAVSTKMKANSKAVADEMTAAGVTLAKMAADGKLSDAEKKTVIRDVVFRLWRKVLTFNGGGHVADHIRDTQQSAVYAKVLAGVSAATTMESLVDMVRAAVIEITF